MLYQITHMMHWYGNQKIASCGMVDGSASEIIEHIITRHIHIRLLNLNHRKYLPVV